MAGIFHSEPSLLLRDAPHISDAEFGGFVAGRSSTDNKLGREARAERLTPELIRILLVDPRPLTAEAVRSYLEKAVSHNEKTRFCVVAALPCGKVPSEQKFDLLLLHVSPSASVGAEIERCLGMIPVALRGLPTAVFSDSYSASDVAAAMQHGARGYLPSILDCDSIVDALRLLAGGLAVFPHAALSFVLSVSGGTGNGGPSQTVQGRTAPACLTIREWEVLEALHVGKPNKTIAREMRLSQSTVKVHVRSVFRKLGVRNRTEAAIVGGQHLLGRDHPSLTPTASV